MADVQVHAVRTNALHFVVYGSGHNISRGKFAAFVKALHEALTVGQAQNTALTADGFGNQKRTRMWVIQTRGVELVELHVCDATACTPCHGDAVASRAVRIAGIQIDFAGAACG